MNSTEHKFVFQLLVQTIQDLTSAVIYLNSNECPNIGHAIKQISDCILNEEVLESMDLDENQIKRLTLGMLFNINEKQIINKSSNNFKPPIVLFIDEFESFDHSLVTHLILIIKEYIDWIPFILVFSTSNTSTSIQYSLPSSATDFLLLHHFSSIPENQILDQLFNETIINSDIAFKLGPNVLKFIIKMFQLFDFSIQNFRHLLKYALFEHYYSNELSFLCQSIRKLKKYIKKIDNKDLELLCNSSPLMSSFKSSLNGEDLKKSLINNMEELQLIHNQFVAHLKILVKLFNQSNEELIDLKQLYINALDKSFDYKQVIDRFNKFSQNQWKTSLENCLSDNSLNDKTLPLIIALKSSHKELCDLIIKSQNEPQVVLERVDISGIKDKLSNLKTRSQWKDTINPMNRPKVISKFDVWKKTTISSIEKVLRDSTIPTSYPLHEALFFDDLDVLKRHNFVVVRNDIQYTLNNPSLILNKSESFVSTKESQSNPDFNSLFILYQESQSIVNLYDWFTAFKSDEQVINFAKNSKRKKTENIKSENTDQSLVVRFLNTISDFEYIGLIQAAKRKTDHLMKLVWF
jgi:hypothetical protein